MKEGERFLINFHSKIENFSKKNKNKMKKIKKFSIFEWKLIRKWRDDVTWRYLTLLVNEY